MKTLIHFLIYRRHYPRTNPQGQQGTAISVRPARGEGTERGGEEGGLPFWRWRKGGRKGLVRRELPIRSRGCSEWRRRGKKRCAFMGGARRSLGFSPGIRAVFVSWAAHLGRCWAAHSVPLRPCPCETRPAWPSLSAAISSTRIPVNLTGLTVWVKRPK